MSKVATAVNNNNNNNNEVKKTKKSPEKEILKSNNSSNKKNNSANEIHITHDEKHYDTSLKHLENGVNGFKKIIELFYQNKFDDGIAYGKQKEDTCIYHSLGKSYLSFMGGLMTLEPEEISKAKEDVYQTIHLCQKLRHSSNIFSNISHFFWKENFDKFSDIEVHSELVYAECNLVMTLLMFFGDQSFLSLIKGAFAIRASNQSFKYCAEILKERKWENNTSKIHFESGVYNGLGLLNIVLSMLPTKILRILSMIGFSGDRDKASELLAKSLENKDGLRYCVTATAYKCFELFVEQLIGVGDANYELMKKIMKEFTVKYPKACFVLFFSAKMNMINGDAEKAIEEYHECISLQDNWIQIHNLCRWDLFVCYSLIGDWENSVKLSKILLEQCAFSPAISAYRLAAIMHMQMKATNKPEFKKEIDELMSKIPGMKMRYAGKTLPQEKLCILRAEQYIQDGHILIAPIYEFHYIWNSLLITKSNMKIAEKIIKSLDDDISEVEKLNHKFKTDFKCRLLLLKGVIMRNMNKDENAMQCFNEIIEKEKAIIRDMYLLPHATLELGLTFMKILKYTQAKHWLNKTTEYHEFLVESLVQLRVHNSLRLIKQLEKDKNQK